MSINTRIKAAVSAVAGQPVLVRFRQSCVTDRLAFDCGGAHLLEHDLARMFIKAGQAVELTSEADVAFAKSEIAKRDAQ